ncbi:hypothetical protein HDU92_004503 [Lobulomyces angularis]|nr:hypothetical protein HDU92_004503 [Lobulomyces angularis]
MIFSRLATRGVSQIQKRFASNQVGPYGPVSFEGINWVGAGALPFQVKRKASFVIKFYIVAIFGFSIPFLNVEKNIAGRRAERRKQIAEGTAPDY